jgi:hypothetical protein
MSSRTLPVALALVTFGGFATSDAARAAVPQALLDIALRSSFPSREKQTVDQWVQQRIEQLTAANTREAATSFQADFQIFSRPGQDSEVSYEFRELLAEKCSDRFPGALQGMDGIPAQAMAMVLADLRAAKTVGGLRACLEHGNAGVRYWGAKGLHLNQDIWNRSASTAGPAVAALTAASGRESNEIIVSKIFAALSFEPGARSEVVVPELIKAVDAFMPARIEAYRTGQVRQVAADREWPGILVNLARDAKTPTAQKSIVLGYVSKLLVAATELYIDGERRYRGNGDNLPLLDPSEVRILYRPKHESDGIGAGGLAPNATLPDVVAACEAACRRAALEAKIDGEYPKIYELLMVDRSQPLEVDKIRLELVEWVGTNAAPGLLNKPPLNVKVPSPFKVERVSADPTQ